MKLLRKLSKIHLIKIASKLKKAELDIKNLVSKIEEFESINNTIKPSEELSDHEVINHMLKIAEWKL